MPLIIAVLAIIVAVSWAKNSNNELSRKNRQYSAAARKTNAKMERRLVDTYMKFGLTFDEAFALSREDMINKGFEPCIPKNAYRPRSWDELDGAPPHTSECHNCEQYDSEAVKKLRSDYQRECQMKKVPYSAEEEDRYVYESGRLPTTAAQYNRYLTKSLSSHKYDAVEVGKYVSYIGYGTCEVIALDFEKSMHTVKVLRTGAIIKIPFGDKNLTKL